MSHESECPYNDESLVPTRTFFGDVEVSVDCTFCGVIRAAYRRGREDAAEATFKAFMGQELTPEALGVWVACRQAAWGR